MAEHKGKPSGKFAEDKKDIGRKGDYQRGGWPEESNTQREQREQPGEAEGRNRKEGSPR
jgi:hypothetical protein